MRLFASAQACLHASVQAGFRKKQLGLLILSAFMSFFSAMMNELLKIQQDMGTPQQQHRRDKAALRDENEPDILADPNDWVADLPKFGIYHHGYTTNHWLQVFRPLKHQ